MGGVGLSIHRCIFILILIVGSTTQKADAFASDKKYDEFDAKEYLRIQYPKSLFDNPDPNLAAIHSMRCHHDFCKQFHKQLGSTARLLDLGGGPCVHCHISYVPYVTEIYHSDYVEACRNEVLLWKNADTEAHDWYPYFKYVVNTVEGQPGEDTVSKRIEMARNKLQDVLFCDVKNVNILPNDVEKKFDIILSTWCIENLVNSVAEYCNILKKVNLLLNPDGFFVTIVNLKSTYYRFQGRQYPCFPITEENVVSSLQQAGFLIQFKSCYYKPEHLIKSNTFSDTTGKGFFVAQI